MNDNRYFSGIQLTNGTIVNMDVSTTGEAIVAFDNLVSMIVKENFTEVLKNSDDEQNYGRAIDILEREVNHVVENEVFDHKAFLESVLSTLVLERCMIFLENE